MPETSGDDRGEKTTAEDSATFECNICLDTAKDAVISMCGHLFCWPCLHQWLETRPQGQVCPVCKAGISRDKVIPLYGRGGSKSDPREKLPPRPQGHRTEPEAEYSMGTGANRFVFGESNTSFQMSLGIGAFPFGFFASTFNLGAGPPPAAAAMDQQSDAARSPDLQMQDQLVSKLFLWLACMFLFWLVAA